MPFDPVEIEIGRDGGDHGFWRKAWCDMGRSRAAEREILRLERRVSGQDHRALDRMAQRADIARPVMRGQRRARRRRQGGGGAVIALRIMAEEMIDQCRHVFLPVAQGGKFDLHRVEPEQQILAEQAIVAQLRRGHVGRGDDADIDRHRPVGADRRDLPLFEHGEQFGLQMQRQIADLVEEQGAAAGRLDAPDPVALGVGKGAFHMTEQLGIDQLGGDRAEIDGQHRLPGAQ